MLYVINHLEECLAYQKHLRNVSYLHLFTFAAAAAAWGTGSLLFHTSYTDIANRS